MYISIDIWLLKVQEMCKNEVKKFWKQCQYTKTALKQSLNVSIN